jgi:hypothetical protein
MNTKRIGEISEAHILTALFEKGYAVLLPFGDNQRYDLVVEIEGRFLRVQVKTGKYINGTVCFRTVSSSVHRTGGKVRSYVDDVDYFGVYCPQIQQSYLVPIDDVRGNTRTVNMRVEPARKNDPFIVYAEQYKI